MTVGYPVRAGGRVQGGAAAVGAAVSPSPPPALTVGQPIEIHQASCHDPDQHERVTLTGEIVLVHDDGAGLAFMADGTWVEVCPWYTSDCPNSVPVSQEAAA